MVDGKQCLNKECQRARIVNKESADKKTMDLEETGVKEGRHSNDKEQKLSKTENGRLMTVVVE